MIIGKLILNILPSKTQYFYKKQYRAICKRQDVLNMRKSRIDKLADQYQNILDGIMGYDEWNPNLRKIVHGFSRPYFRWLLENGYKNISCAGASALQNYLKFYSENKSSYSLNDTKYYLKRLYEFLYYSNLSESSYAMLFSFPVCVERKVKPAISTSEVSSTLEAVDRKTVIGKRDYAILLLGVVVGLRCIDIAKLRFSDIYWHIGEIHVCQSKTGAYLALPLTTDVGQAIKDYILNSRPKSNLLNVFLTFYSPHREISAMVANNIHTKYRMLAGLPRKGFHGLRRTVGKNLVTAGIPVTTVAQILGHNNIISTKQYISLDSCHLKDCSISFDGIQIGGRVL